MISLHELQNDVNVKEYNITENESKLERHGFCRYIIEISSYGNIPNEIASLAMMYLNKFFLKKLYVNYDKRLMSCAALLLACKVEDFHDCNIKSIVRSHVSKDISIFDNKNKKSIDDLNYLKEIGQKIINLEVILLKHLEFKVKYYLPKNFITFYCYNLFKFNMEEYQTVLELAYKIEADSFFTYVNNLFPSYVVALSCIEISCKLIGIKSITDKEFYSEEKTSGLCDFYVSVLNSDITSSYYSRDKSKLAIYNNPGEIINIDNFNKKILHFDSELPIMFNPITKTVKYDKKWYNSLSWNKKLHPFLEENEFFSSVFIITEHLKDDN